MSGRCPRNGNQLNFSYGPTHQFWLDRMEGIVDKYLKDKIQGGVLRDMKVRTSQSASYLGLRYLHEELGGKTKIKKTMNIWGLLQHDIFGASTLYAQG